MIRRLLAILLVPAGLPALAAVPIPSHCIALAEGVPGVTYVAGGPTLTPAQADPVPVPGTEAVRIHFVGHATYLIESPAGVRIATDFTGYVGSDIIPDVVTMNHAHSSHWTASPDPRIPHVLRGWGTPEAPADHFVTVGDAIIRNVTTDIRAFGSVEPDGNSIFVFEIAGLCLGHLGHLHHEPSPAQSALIGRLDVVMAPVDGGFTMDQAAMIRVLKTAKARLVLPMHWFGQSNLERFLEGMADEFAIERTQDSAITVSLATLPREPKVLALRPTLFSDD